MTEQEKLLATEASKAAEVAALEAALPAVIRRTRAGAFEEAKKAIRTAMPPTNTPLTPHGEGFLDGLERAHLVVARLAAKEPA